MHPMPEITLRDEGTQRVSRGESFDSKRAAVAQRLCGVAMALLPCMGAAQAKDGNPAALEAIVVSATREPEDALLIPAAIDVIVARDIRRAQPAIHLSESLQRVPGVVARDRQNYAQDLQISIRGYGARSTFGVRGVRLYTDGIPASMPDGQGQVSHFALESADRIEVLRGPFSALYGNSSGGVISLFTADAPAAAEFGGGFVAGSDGLQRMSLSLRAPWGARRDGSALLDLSEVDTEGYRDHSAAQRRNAQALLKGTFGSDGHYTLLANALNLQADDPQGLTATDLRGDRRAASPGALNFDTRKSVSQEQFGARIERRFSAGHMISATAWTGNRATAQMLSVPVAVQRNSPLHNGGAIDLDRDYFGVDARWQWSAELLDRPFSLTTGMQVEVADERRRGYENFVGTQLGVIGALRRDEDNHVRGQDFYLQADWVLAERWRVNAGARRSEVRFDSRDRYLTAANPDDSGQVTFSRSSPVAGVLFRATPWLSLYANAGSGFETPTFAELAYRSDGASGLNVGLRPARSENQEIGFRARQDRWSASAAMFHSRTEDELVVVSNQGGRSVFDNAGLTRRRGIELAFAGELSEHWHVATSYTFLDARYRSDFTVCGAPPCAQGDALIAAGRHIPGLARHFAWSELRWTPRADTDLLLQGRYSDRVFVDDRNRSSAPSYTSFDLGAERRFDAAGLQWRAFARLNNVLDRDIIGSVIVNDANGRYFEPAPGRHWVAGLSLTRAF